MRGAPVGAVVVLVALPVGAEEARPAWQADVRASYTILGAHRPTGGVMPVVAARRLWWLGGWGLGAGLSVGVFGLGADAHWLGVLAGPAVSVETRPLALPLDLGRGSFSASLAADLGRVPICNAWDLCLRFWGLAPRAELGLGYHAGNHVTANLGLGARLVLSPVWKGISWEPTVGGRFSW